MWLKDANQFMSNKELYSVQPVRSGSKVLGDSQFTPATQTSRRFCLFCFSPPFGGHLTEFGSETEGRKEGRCVCVCVCVCLCEQPVVLCYR